MSQALEERNRFQSVMATIFHVENAKYRSVKCKQAVLVASFDLDDSKFKLSFFFTISRHYLQLFEYERFGFSLA